MGNGGVDRQPDPTDGSVAHCPLPAEVSSPIEYRWGIVGMSTSWDWKLEDAIEEIDAGIFLIDLGFQNRKEVVAAYLLVSDDDLVLIETGPGSTIDHLRRAMKRIGFTFQDLTRVFVTHIHLDHAG